MAAIGSLSSLVNRGLAADARANAVHTVQPQTSGNGNSFGNAVNLTLSAPAQAALSNQPAAPSAPTASAPIGISSSTSSDEDETLLVEEAKQQVIPKVGITGADEVVDNKGDIDQVKLNELIDQQETQAATQQSLVA